MLLLNRVNSPRFAITKGHSRCRSIEIGRASGLPVSSYTGRLCIQIFRCAAIGLAVARDEISVVLGGKGDGEGVEKSGGIVDDAKS